MNKNIPAIVAAILAAIITGGTVLIFWLKADTARLEERAAELELQKAQLFSQMEELQAENNRLSK